MDRLLGGEGADDLFGGSEDDTLEGGAGDDYLDGGFGADLAVFTSARSEYRIDRFEGDALVIGPDGTDRTSSVETFVFTDGEVVLDELTEDDALTVEQAQTVAYLYEAGLDRDGDIDEPGLNFWIDQREAGMSEAELSLAFLLSTEFEAAFGNPVDPEAPNYLEDEELVATLYENVLDREADEGGLAFWLDLLQQEDVSRADLLLAFAVSEENMEGSPHVETLEKVAPGEWAFV